MAVKVVLTIPSDDTLAISQIAWVASTDTAA